MTFEEWMRAVLARVETALDKHRSEIDEILADYRVPRLDGAPQ